MPHTKARLDEARRAYRFHLPIPRRCTTCRHHDGEDPGGECELLSIVVARAERSRCPAWEHWDGDDAFAEKE